MTAPSTAIAGTGSAQQGDGQAQPVPAGALFGVPKYSTQRRFVPDNGNQNVGAVPQAASQINVPTTRLDQLDIVQGIKVAVQYGGTWTNTGAGLEVSPFFPASIVQQITFKLQAAYNTFNLTGPLAAIIQAFRPMWGNRQVGSVSPDAFCDFGANQPTLGDPYTVDFNIDIPFAVKFDEYFDLSAQGDPVRKIYDAIVSPMYMAAQARVVVPTVTIAPQLKTGDLLGSPVSRLSADVTSTYADSAWACQFARDAWWTANSPAANPPQYPWLYTRDYFTQPTQGQGQVGCLIQNTGVSVGQVLSLFGFVWDPEADSGLGAIVPMSAIDRFELITGGSLQNREISPQQLLDEMRSKFGFGIGEDASFPSGVFVFDFAMEPDGAYLSNANAINTYLVNGVQLNVFFKSDSIPSSTASVYLGVEALKLATS